MSKIRKKPLIIALSSFVVVSAAGTIGSTYAWYSYNKMAVSSITGTSIRDSEIMEVGLRSNHRLNVDPVLDVVVNNNGINTNENQTFEEKYASEILMGEIEIENVTIAAHTEYIYWIRSNVLSEILIDFQKSIGSATDSIRATTAGYYHEGMKWDLGNRDADKALDAKWNGLKTSPIPEDGHRDYSGFATNKDVISLPLAFRVDSDEDPSTWEANQPVYMTRFSTLDVTNQTSNVDKALRCMVTFPEVVDVDNEPTHAQDYIFNPNKAEDENLKVGGALDLSNTIYYDYDRTTLEEVPYGQFDGEPIYGEVWDEDPTIPFSEHTTFKANHKKGVKVLKDDNARTCQTRGSDYIISPSKNTPLVTTNNQGYGYADLSIFLEGWDKHIIDSNAQHVFTISIYFEIE